jgi:SAM-dependent methyltransferase
LRIEPIQSLMDQGAYGEALSQLHELIMAEPLSSRLFQLLGELRHTRGELDAAEFAYKRCEQLEQIESNTKCSFAGERYRAICAVHNQTTETLSIGGYSFPCLRLEASGAAGASEACWCCVGISADGQAFIEVQLNGPDVGFRHACDVLQRLADGNCQSVASCLNSGELEGNEAAILDVVRRESGATMELSARWPYRITRYARADRGGFGAADLVLSLLEQQALGVFQNELTLRNIRYDSVARICRLSDFSQARYLDPEIRGLAPRAYIAWCLQAERQRVALGGAHSYLLGAIQAADWMWQAERLNLLSTQLFAEPRLRHLPEPSILSIFTDQLYYQGSRDWDRQREALSQLELGRGESILDLGCGLGSAARYFSGQSAVVTSVDIETSLLQAARLVANICGYRMDARCCDLDYESLEGSWDVVLALAVLHNYFNRAEAFGRIAQACRGKLIIECGLVERGHKWLGRWYERGEKWSFDSCDALRAAVLDWFPDFRMVGTARETHLGRWLFVLERKI